MNRVECATQTEMDRAIADGALPILIGSGRFVAWVSAHVVARESAHVVAWVSAHVVAWESAHVEAWESAHVVAWGSAHVVARGSAHVVASKLVAIHRHGTRTTVAGGVVIDVIAPTTATGWADYYGASVIDDVVIVFKALRADLKSAHGLLYEIGATPEAPDWDAAPECGGGLHFSPHPMMAREFDADATRFIACPVALADMRAPQRGDSYPNKIKARRICGPIVEVDRYGKPV